MLVVVIIECRVLGELLPQNIPLVYLSQFRHQFLPNWALDYIYYLGFPSTPDHDSSKSCYFTLLSLTRVLCPQMHLSVVPVTNLKILYNCLWSSPSPVQNLPLAMAKGWWSLFCFNHHVPDTVHGTTMSLTRCTEVVVLGAAALGAWSVLCPPYPHTGVFMWQAPCYKLSFLYQKLVCHSEAIFFCPPVCIGARPFTGSKISIFWECTQGVSLREAPRTYQNPVLAYHHGMRSLLQVICYKFVSKESTSSEETWKCKWDMSF